MAEGALEPEWQGWEIRDRAINSEELRGSRSRSRDLAIVDFPVLLWAETTTVITLGVSTLRYTRQSNETGFPGIEIFSRKIEKGKGTGKLSKTGIGTGQGTEARATLPPNLGMIFSLNFRPLKFFTHWSTPAFIRLLKSLSHCKRYLESVFSSVICCSSVQILVAWRDPKEQWTTSSMWANRPVKWQGQDPGPATQSVKYSCIWTRRPLYNCTANHLLEQPVGKSRGWKGLWKWRTFLTERKLSHIWYMKCTSQ